MNDVPAAADEPRPAAHLTPEQVAGLLGGQILGSYPASGSPGPARYGPRDATTILMAHGRRVALRDGAYFLDGKRVTPQALERAAAELEPRRRSRDPD